MVFHTYTHLGSKRNFRIARVNAPTLQFKVSFLEKLNKTETDLSQFWVEIRKHFFTLDGATQFVQRMIYLLTPFSNGH